MVRSILVPLDGSELAEQALPLALSIAARSGAEVTLLQAVPLPIAPVGFGNEWLLVDDQLELLEREARNYLGELAGRVQAALPAGQRPTELRQATTIGPAAQAIADYATANRADLIVMATHGRSGLSRWALGSVTDQVLQLSHVPVLIVRPPEEAPVRFDSLPAPGRIMITLDGSELAERVLPTATEMARVFEAELLLFRVALLPAVYYMDAGAAAFQLDFLESAKEEAAEYLEQVAQALRTQGARVRTAVGVTPIVESILDVAAEAGVDLIAMTTHGRTGLGRVVYGSVTDRIVRSSACPVLVVRSASAEPAPAPSGDTEDRRSDQ